MNLKVLVVEDEMVTAEIIKGNLEKWGYDVIYKSTAVEALELLQGEAAPKLVLLDWNLPGGMTGVELCERLRTRERGSYIYIIMLTALIEKDYVVEALEKGADDYLTKPINFSELKARLQTGRRILAMEAELTATLRQLKGLIVQGGSPQEKEVFDHLTGREIDILRQLALGKTPLGIAQIYHMGPDWINAHLNNLMQKFNVTTPEALMRKAIDAKNEGRLNEKSVVI